MAVGAQGHRHGAPRLPELGGEPPHLPVADDQRPLAGRPPGLPPGGPPPPGPPRRGTRRSRAPCSGALSRPTPQCGRGSPARCRRSPPAGRWSEPPDLGEDLILPPDPGAQAGGHLKEVASRLLPRQGPEGAVKEGALHPRGLAQELGAGGQFPLPGAVELGAVAGGEEDAAPDAGTAGQLGAGASTRPLVKESRSRRAMGARGRSNRSNKFPSQSRSFPGVKRTENSGSPGPCRPPGARPAPPPCHSWRPPWPPPAVHAAPGSPGARPDAGRAFM